MFSYPENGFILILYCRLSSIFYKIFKKILGIDFILSPVLILIVVVSIYVCNRLLLLK